jgi:alpha-tubulin suppressor-like RCC1 family protein
MTPIHRTSKVFFWGLFVLWVGLAVRQAAQGSMAVMPANPTISVGQTQQFTATGVVTPTSVSAGGEYTCVRLSDGTAQCTGRNGFGQLGNGSWTDSWVLGPVSGLTSVSRVAAGAEFACALLANGTAKCWGLGESGQRGDNSFSTFAFTPVSVNGLTGAVALAAGFGHTCALLTNATLRCWGENREGQLGNGTTANPGTAQPVTVSGITTAAAVTTGAYHTCALLTNGTLRCWGRNHQGQLGNGTYVSSSTPVAVAGLTGVAAVSGSDVHTCAVLTDGTVRCWGENAFGQLGDGSTFTSSTPVQVVGINNAVDVSVGWRHTCALLGDGTVRCWGENQFRQLGNGTTTNSTTPVAVSGISGAVGVTAGWYHHSCALLGSGTVRCWGQNDFGQFGNNTTTDSSTPVTMPGTGVAWTSSNTAVATINAAGQATGVSPGTTTITATDSSGSNASTTLTVSGQAGQFDLSVVRSGSGTGTVTSTPAGINCGPDCSESYNSGTNVTLTASAASGSTFSGWSGCNTVSGTTCSVTMNSAKTVTATFNLQAQSFTLTVTKLGSGTGTVTSSPAGINCGADCSEPYTSGTTVTLTAAAGGGSTFGGWSGCNTVSDTTCSVTMSSAKTVTATFNQSTGITTSAVSAGGEYTCVRLSDGTVQCTGRNGFGQHGNGTLNDSTRLGPVSGLSTVSQFIAGDEFACALLANGTAKCWGLGESGQRGDNSFSTFALTPVTVNTLTGATAIAAGYGHACALLADSTMRCWGENREGQLGNGATANPGTAQPVIVSGISGATAITTGAYHTCALLNNGTLRCWGRNHQGQLGNGTATSSSTAVTVSGLTGVAAVSGGGVHTCAVLNDGTVRCWGENLFGQLGNGSTATSYTPVQVTGISNAVNVSVGWRHTCALLGDGTVRCWGENINGKLGNGTTTNSTTPVPVSGLTGAVGVTAGWWQHSCALLGNGTVKCWGSNQWGQFGSGTTTSSSTPVTMIRN